MKRNASLVALLAAVLSVGPATLFAQGIGPGKGQGGARGQQMERPGDFGPVRKQSKDWSGAQQQDRERDQDRLKQPDSPRMKDSDIYGSELMSAKERNQYRKQIRNAESIEAREQLRAEHQSKMQARAKAQGVNLAPTSEGPIYGGAMLTAQERNQYREQLRSLDSDVERRKFMAEHKEQMQARSKAQGIPPEDLEIEEAE